MSWHYLCEFISVNMIRLINELINKRQCKYILLCERKVLFAYLYSDLPHWSPRSAGRRSGCGRDAHRVRTVPKVVWPETAVERQTSPENEKAVAIRAAHAVQAAPLPPQRIAAAVAVTHQSPKPCQHRRYRLRW